MDTRNGQLHPSRQAALAAGVPADAVVEISGTSEAIATVATALRDSKAVARRRAATKVARRSRRQNRGR